MRQKAKIFISYFAILLIAAQVIINLLFFFAYNFYVKYGFYLNTFFGTNIMFSVFLIALTHTLKFCSISRVSAYTEFAYGLFYLVIKDDGVYNVLFQVVTGVAALLWTFRVYIRKYPLCRLSMMATFIWGVVFGATICLGGGKTHRPSHRAICG